LTRDLVLDKGLEHRVVADDNFRPSVGNRVGPIRLGRAMPP